ncbi:MAG: hypothetical protein H7Y43_05945 [Akkermansiaceae bacterium]|nr:hypothetical protein [Verrucomicrobiales bacterium]
MNAKEKQRKILLPVNAFGREFDGKLLLALLSHERGFHSFLGAKTALHKKLQQLSPMLYVAKSAHTKSAEFFAQLRRSGNQIAVLDEESLVRQSDEIYLMKHHRDALKNVAFLLTWGEDDQNLWRSSGLLHQASAAAVGNPRVDMLRPAMRSYYDAEVSSITDRFGDYVLINTNFPVVNNYITLGDHLSLADKTDYATSERQKFLNYKRGIFERFKDVIPDLSKHIYPRNLIIRPHPSELQEPWLEVAKGLGNVHVILEGSVVPWLIGARALIHNGCTSAIEYALLDKVPLSYRSGHSGEYENSLPNKLSVACPTKAALLRELSLILRAKKSGLPEAQRQILNGHIEIEDTRLCGEAILDAVNGSGPYRQSRPWFSDLHGAWREGLTFIRKFRKSFHTDKTRKRADNRNKFPDFGTDYVDARIKRFQDCLDRFHGMRSRQVARRLFEIV